jgi:hypothetical protein
VLLKSKRRHHKDGHDAGGAVYVVPELLIEAARGNGKLVHVAHREVALVGLVRLVVETVHHHHGTDPETKEAIEGPAEMRFEDGVVHDDLHLRQKRCCDLAIMRMHRQIHHFLVCAECSLTIPETIS